MGKRPSVRLPYRTTALPPSFPITTQLGRFGLRREGNNVDHSLFGINSIIVFASAPKLQELGFIAGISHPDNHSGERVERIQALSPEAYTKSVSRLQKLVNDSGLSLHLPQADVYEDRQVPTCIAGSSWRARRAVVRVVICMFPRSEMYPGLTNLMLDPLERMPPRAGAGPERTENTVLTHQLDCVVSWVCSLDTCPGAHFRAASRSPPPHHPSPTLLFFTLLCCCIGTSCPSCVLPYKLPTSIRR